MKLEVGMYVKTKEGIITKIIDNRDNVIVKTDDNTTHLRSMITKASNKLIDLIEVGDYVNGYKCYEIKENCVMVGYKCFATRFNEEEDFLYQTIYDNEINSIVTKEQFNSIKYEVDSNE